MAECLCVIQAVLGSIPGDDQIFSILYCLKNKIKNKKPVKERIVTSNIIIVGERADTYRGNTIENRGCLFIYLDICMNVCMSFCTLYPPYFCVRSAFDPVPNFTKQNPLV